MDRSLGSGLIFEHTPLASIYAHGKAFFDENDFYTHTGGEKRDPSSTILLSVGKAFNLEETLAHLRLAFAQGIVRGKHGWFAELAGWLGEFRASTTRISWRKSGA